MDNSLRHLIYKLRDAVVMISGHFIDDENNLNIIKGNGFFIGGHYIICPTSLIMIKTKMVTKILIEVSNVNGDGSSYSYSAYIIGFDGLGNIAILKINNEGNPVLRVCHPYLSWGKSRNCCPGDDIIMIGDILGNHCSENGICCGYLSDNRYVNSNIIGELLLLDIYVRENDQCGLPILDYEGKIIGMYIGNNVGISEFFMRRPLKHIVMAYHNIPTKFVNSDFRYIKSWLGISAIISCQDDYETIIDKNLKRTLMQNDKILSRDIIAIISCQDDYETIIDKNLKRTLMKNDKIVSRDIIGYRILSMLNISPLYNILHEGDIITHINGCPLGDRKGQISPSLLLWRIYPGDIITVIYKKQEEKFEQVHECKINTLLLDIEYDYPHKEIISYVTI